MNERIRQVFADHLHVEIPSDDVDLIDSGLLDSLLLVDLLVRLEKEFGFTVVMDELDLEDFRTVRSMAAYVSRLSSESTAAASTNGRQRIAK